MIFLDYFSFVVYHFWLRYFYDIYMLKINLLFL